MHSDLSHEQTHLVHVSNPEGLPTTTPGDDFAGNFAFAFSCWKNKRFGKLRYVHAMFEEGAILSIRLIIMGSNSSCALELIVMMKGFLV